MKTLIIGKLWPRCTEKGCPVVACWRTPDGRLVCIEHGKGIKGKTRPWRTKSTV